MMLSPKTNVCQHIITVSPGVPQLPTPLVASSTLMPSACHRGTQKSSPRVLHRERQVLHAKSHCCLVFNVKINFCTPYPITTWSSTNGKKIFCTQKVIATWASSTLSKAATRQSHELTRHTCNYCEEVKGTARPG